MTTPSLLRDRLLLPLLGVLVVATLWEATVRIYQLPVVVLPTPWGVARTFGKLVVTASFWRDVGVSLYEFGVGYAVGVAVGVLLGIALGESRLFRMTASPVIEAFRFVDRHDEFGRA